MNIKRLRFLLPGVFAALVLCFAGCQEELPPEVDYTYPPTERPIITEEPTEAETKHVHDFDAWVITTEPDCTANGSKTRTCKGCGETETDVVPFLGHDPVLREAVAPTCTEPGREAGKICTRCDTALEGGKTVKPLGHTPVTDPAVEPTCTEAGLTEGW